MLPLVSYSLCDMDGRIFVSALAFLMTIFILPTWAQSPPGPERAAVPDELKGLSNGTLPGPEGPVDAPVPNLENGAVPDKLQDLLNGSLPGSGPVDAPVPDLENGAVPDGLDNLLNGTDPLGDVNTLDKSPAAPALPANLENLLNGSIPSGNDSDNLPMVDVGNKLLPSKLQQFLDGSLAGSGSPSYDRASDDVGPSDDNLRSHRNHGPRRNPLKKILRLPKLNIQFPKGLP